MNSKKQKIIYYTILLIFLTLFSIIASIFIDIVLSNDIDFFINGNFNLTNIISRFFENKKVLQLFALCEAGELLIIAYIVMQQKTKRSNVAELVEVAKGIKIPKSAGEGQYGTARFMKKEEIDQVFDKIVLDKNNPNIQKLLKDEKTETFLENSGLVVNFEKKGNKETIYYIGDDIHTLTIGSTRSRKNKTDLFFKRLGVIRIKWAKCDIYRSKGRII